METNLKYINLICTDLGGVGGHFTNLAGENEICTLLGGTGGHFTEIAALNEICTIQGVTAGHVQVLAALNAIAGVTKVTNLEGWKYIQVGTVLNQTPAILKDGNTVAWYDSQDLSNITKSVGGAVSLWKDKLLSGHDLIQETEAAQPLWSYDGITFDGINDYLKTLPFVYSQPEHIYLLLKQITWADSDGFMDGNLLSTAQLYQRTSSPRIRMYGNGDFINNETLALNTWGVLKLSYNGLSSYFQIDDMVKSTGNATANMGGITLGSNGALSTFANFIIKEAIFRKVLDAPADEAIIYDYLSKKKITGNELLDQNGTILLDQNNNYLTI